METIQTNQTNITDTGDLNLTWRPVFSGTLISLSAIIVALSSLVMVVILKSRELHHTTGIILGNAALTYWLLGMSRICVEIVFISIGVTCGWFIKIYFTLCFVCNMVCLMLLTLLTVDRYVSVSRPLHYWKIMTVRKIKMVITVFWIGNSIVYGLLTNVGISHFTQTAVGCGPRFKFRLMYVSTIPPICCGVITVVCYILIIHTSINQQRRPQSSVPTAESWERKHSMKTLILSVTLMVTFILFRSPVVILTVVSQTMITPSLSNRKAVSILVMMSTAGVGHIVVLVLIASTYRPFKRALVKLFCGARYRRRRASLFLVYVHQATVDNVLCTPAPMRERGNDNSVFMKPHSKLSL